MMDCAPTDANATDADRGFISILCCAGIVVLGAGILVGILIATWLHG